MHKMENIIYIWCISDTHGLHEQLRIPDKVDMVIHAGDNSNDRTVLNYYEGERFIKWFDKLPITKKVMIAGNHDRWLNDNKSILLDYPKIKYLELSTMRVNNTKIHGTPYTPVFRNWSFMLNLEKLEDHSKSIQPCNILVSHGPPKYILDSVYRDTTTEGVRIYEHCGDIHLYNRVKKIRPALHIFGHIHSGDKYPANQGIYFDGHTYFINVACVNDGKMHHVKNHGWIIEYDTIGNNVLRCTKC